MEIPVTLRYHYDLHNDLYNVISNKFDTSSRLAKVFEMVISGTLLKNIIFLKSTDPMKLLNFAWPLSSLIYFYFMEDVILYHIIATIIYKLGKIMERKRNSEFYRIFTEAFLRFQPLRGALTIRDQFPNPAGQLFKFT